MAQENNVKMAAEKMQPMVSMYKLFNAAQDPMAMLQQAAGNNEAFSTILQQTQIANGNPEQAFYAQAHQQGLTDEQINTGLAQLEQILGVKRP